MAGTFAFVPGCSVAWQLRDDAQDSSLGSMHAPDLATSPHNESDLSHGSDRKACRHSTVSVKNTFIHAVSVDEETDEEDALPMVASKSCPVVRLSSFSPTSSQPSPSSTWVSPSSAWADASSEDDFAPAQKFSRSHNIVPMEVRTPEPSAGSMLHGTGECKPCAWFWRPQGCDNGGECRHCHLCLRGELKERKKARAVATRKPTRRSTRFSTRSSTRSSTGLSDEPEMQM